MFVLRIVSCLIKLRAVRSLLENCKVCLENCEVFG